MTRKSVGIYIHIPFCVKKCNYCDFLSGPCDKAGRTAYIEALKKEIRARASEINVKYSIATIYFGGGTPSLLEASEIEDILECVKSSFLLKMSSGELINDGPVESEAEKVSEITIEVNPGTVDLNKFEAYRKMGINRVSIGVQSSNNEELKLLGRIHTFEEGKAAFYAARQAGFDNISVDIMSALPGQSLDAYRDNLKKILALEPEHISAYSLIIEEGTVFFDRYGDGGNLKNELPSEDLDREMYALTKKKLLENGYSRYEISNYSLKGYESKHNSSYWTGTDYFGFGLGAASLLQNIRYSNCRDLKEYIKDPVNTRQTDEVLTKEARMSEFMILGLRMCKGVSRTDFMTRFQTDIMTVYGKEIEALIADRLLIAEGDRLYLTDYGLDISNFVFEKFI